MRMLVLDKYEFAREERKNWEGNVITYMLGNLADRATMYRMSTLREAWYRKHF